MMNTANLTTGFEPQLEQQIRRTYDGMAHWAGSGPEGATCGDCVFWGYTKETNNFGYSISPRRVHKCRRFLELTKKHGASIPASAGACRHFQPKGDGR